MGGGGGAGDFGLEVRCRLLILFGLLGLGGGKGSVQRGLASGQVRRGV